MSRFLSKKLSTLKPYTPGEQPRDQRYVKLNTNESPFPPSPKVVEAATLEARRSNLYCDPECTELKAATAEHYGVKQENVLPVNGSDEILYFAFLAFGDETHPFAAPDISYGFYPVYAKINHVSLHTIPLKDDFSVDYRDYCGLNETIVIANPNAPTGTCMPVWQIEEIVKTNPDNVVIIDEAYIDFGGESCVPLIGTYDNLLVIQTFSKSRSLAGARIGFGIGNETLIGDLNTIKYSVNPYNVNCMTQAAGVAAIQDNAYYLQNAETIQQNRAYTQKRLTELGFNVLPSCANFLFAGDGKIEGGELYRSLKERGVLVRHFDLERISNYCRITIGTKEQMNILLTTIEALLREKGC
jgi:histidinol-phosphate aminotransferase